MAERNMDAVDLLITQHRMMESMLDKVVEAESADEKKALFEKVGDHLTVHIASEEQVFYPAINAARTEDDLLEALEEHLSLKRFLADLLDMDPADKAFEAKFKVLKEQTEHHHREEEEKLFPAVKKLVDGPQRQELGKEMMSLQVQLTRMGEPREAVVNQTAAAAPLQQQP